MMHPGLVIEKVQRAIEVAHGAPWRPSTYLAFQPPKEDSPWQHGLNTRSVKTAAIIDFSSLLATLLFVSLFFLNTTTTNDATLGRFMPDVHHNDPNFETFNLLGDFNGTAIKKLCQHKRFQPGLYFRCDEHDGGIGNVRNSILLCTRYAIEAGAQLISPRIHSRSASNLADLGGKRNNMTYLFDYNLFKERVEDSCPGLNIYDTLDDVPETVQIHRPKDFLDPVDFHVHGGLANTHILDFRSELRGWIHSQLQIHVSKQTPVLVDLKRAYFGWSNTEDSYDVWVEWAKLLQFHPMYYRLAAQVLQLMTKQDIGLNKPEVMRAGFRYVGQHLRTEKDVSTDMAKFGFEPQMSAAVQICKNANITDLYVASGDASEADKATKEGLKNGITVHTKYSLMLQNPELSAEIERLTFDQQALIDYLILLKATKFVGVDSSTFSGNLAVTRHASLNDKTYWKGFSDELTFLLGDRFEWLRDCIWP